MGDETIWRWLPFEGSVGVDNARVKILDESLLSPDEEKEREDNMVTRRIRNIILMVDGAPSIYYLMDFGSLYSPCFGTFFAAGRGSVQDHPTLVPWPDHG